LSSTPLFPANIPQDNIIDHDDIELEGFYSEEIKINFMPQSTTERIKTVMPIIPEEDPRYDYQLQESEDGGMRRFCAHKIKRIFVLC